MSDSRQSGGIFMTQQEGEDLLLVEAYGGGGFRFLDKRVEGSVLVTGAGFFPIDAKTSSDLREHHFEKLMRAGERPEILLVGTGDRMQLLEPALRKYLADAGMAPDLMDTGAAARTFNVLQMEDRKVAALLIQTD